STLGFVPTMGALHQGHISLVNRACEENDRCIVSIFVNPTQFNQNEDFVKYPRNEEADISMLSSTGAAAVFLPSADEMYNTGQNHLEFDLNGLDQVLEGKFRAGHFQGVITIVDKFFSLIQPTKAYFGLKDFQQLVIIRLMAEKLHPNLKIVACPIVREADGLAMSSRNQRLSPIERQRSLILSEALFSIKDRWRKDSFDSIIGDAVKKLESSAARLEYLEIIDPETLQTLNDYPETESVACIAAWVGDVRLIDNIILPASI
ncbi:MAG: pantoate--beta-alanine ligase, partial [Bacteroidetes bacterium]|nr:pantoate--beta-alanine ligase [Bacteroidota bacterium]